MSVCIHSTCSFVKMSPVVFAFIEFKLEMILAEAWRSDLLYWVIPVVIVLALFAFIALGAVLLGLAFYAQYTCGSYQGKTRMDGKTVIITGCTSGIGKETARELAKRGARVIMACRNLKAAEEVKEDIIDTTKNPKVIVKKLDLSSFTSIRAFADDIKKSETRLDVLIHNAGYSQNSRKAKSEDGIEMTMATNHYGPFLLTHLLIDLLKKSSPARIVVVASSWYRFYSFNLENPNPVNTFPQLLYSASKEANILFTRELARRLEGTGVTANCLHPGLVDTRIWKNTPVPFTWGLYLINKCFFKTPQQGCQTTVYLAVDESLSKTSGKYFSDCAESSVSSLTSDLGRARRLWEISEKMVKLEDSDPRI